MKYSKLFGKSRKSKRKDSLSQGHDLLLQAGYIRESSSGRFFFLPLGLKVMDKICSVIEEEVTAIGGQKMLAPILHPISIWEETNRASEVSFELMTVQDRRDATFVLGGTAEEMLVDLVRKFQLSYKDLPLVLFQFSTKFRDELRARGGLLRAREFLMKDAYSFDVDEKAFRETYNAFADAYKRIFMRFGLEAWMVEADNGYMGGDFCHEFVVEARCGESTFYHNDDYSYCIHEDLIPQGADDLVRTSEGQVLTKSVGIEVGNIFQLGYHYSSKMKDACFTSSTGESEAYFMGSYGIGVGRTLGAIAEILSDEHGLVWNKVVAPYLAQLVQIGNEADTNNWANEVYQRLSEEGIEVLFDDRRLTAGEKFADADLLGMPIRLVVSEKTAKTKQIEIRKRGSRESQALDLHQLVGVLADY